MHPRTALIVPVLALALAGCGSDEPADGLNVGDEITEEDREVLDQLAAATEEIENLSTCMEIIENNERPEEDDYACKTEEGLLTSFVINDCGSSDVPLVSHRPPETEDVTWVLGPADTEWQEIPDTAEVGFYDIVADC